MSAPVFVRGVGMWSGAPSSKVEASLLPARMRGRASPLTSMFAAVVDEATREAGVDPARLPSVFGSAYGEMHTTASLLSQLWAAGGVLSPAKFQASVHNTAAAQLSIALHNPSFTTSIAAGHDTVAMSLIEALAWLAPNPGQLLVACAEEAPNEVLQPGVSYPPLAAAFVLDNVAGQGSVRLALSSAHDVDAAHGNPVQPAIELARAIRAGETATVSVGRGYTVVLERQRGGA